MDDLKSTLQTANEKHAKSFHFLTTFQPNSTFAENITKINEKCIDVQKQKVKSYQMSISSILCSGPRSAVPPSANPQVHVCSDELVCS